MAENIFRAYASSISNRGYVPVNAVSSIPYYSIYDGQPVSSYKFGSGTKKNIISIYENYSLEVGRAKDAKFAMFGGPDEFIKEVALNKKEFQKSFKLIKSIGKTADNIKQKTKEVNEQVLSMDTKDLEENTLLLGKKTKSLLETMQSFFDELDKLDDSFSVGLKIENGRYGGLSSSDLQTAKGLRVTGAAYTSVINLRRITKQLEKEIADAENFKNKLAKTGAMEFYAVSTRDGGNNALETKKTINLGNLSKSISGYLTSIKGASLEVETANLLKKSMGEIIEEVEIMGEEEGVYVNYAGGGIGDGGRRIKTSRTDVRFSTKINDLKIPINLSIKNQASGKQKTNASSVKLFSGSLETPIKMISPNSESAELMYAKLVLNRSKEGRDPTGKSFMEFFTALTADFALASAHDDRVDFYLYNDGIVSAEEYLLDLYGKISISIGLKGKGASHKDLKTLALSGGSFLGTSTINGSYYFDKNRKVK